MEKIRLIAIAASLSCMAVGLWPVLDGGASRIGWLSAGAAVLLLALFAHRLPQVRSRRSGRGESPFFSRAGNRIIAVAVFYGVFAPIGLLQRLLGRDALRLRFDDQLPTYWVEHRSPVPSPRPTSLPVEVVVYLKHRKKLWLLPVVLLLLALGMLLSLGPGTAPSTFIYPLY